MVKVLNRDAINRMVDIPTNNVGNGSENVTPSNRSSAQQEQMRKGPDMETRLKELEERVAKLEALHNQK